MNPLTWRIRSLNLAGMSLDTQSTIYLGRMGCGQVALESMWLSPRGLQGENQDDEHQRIYYFLIE